MENPLIPEELPQLIYCAECKNLIKPYEGFTYDPLRGYTHTSCWIATIRLEDGLNELSDED